MVQGIGVAKRDRLGQQNGRFKVVPRTADTICRREDVNVRAGGIVSGPHFRENLGICHFIQGSGSVQALLSRRFEWPVSVPWSQSNVTQQLKRVGGLSPEHAHHPGWQRKTPYPLLDRSVIPSLSNSVPHSAGLRILYCH